MDDKISSLTEADFIAFKAAQRDGGPVPALPSFCDEALALKFAERHAGDLRFVAAWNKWLLWDGARWRVDDTVLAFDRARAICREAAESSKAKLAPGIASARTVAAVTTLARVDRRLAATAEQWDNNPWLLNTPGGRRRLAERTNSGASARRFPDQDGGRRSAR
jgi:D5 N terminal like